MPDTRRAQRWLTVALVAYLAVVLYATLGPNPGERLDRVDRAVEEARGAVRPGGPVVSSSGRSNGGPWPFDLSSEDVGNIAMFVPLPMLVALRWPRRWWAGAPLGVGLSAAIEVTQGTFLTYRTQQLSDWVLNSAGAVLGLALWAVGVWLVSVGRIRGDRPRHRRRPGR